MEDAPEPAGGDDHTIASVPTAVAAFVGAFAQGPLHEPVAVASLADFAGQFGPPDSAGAAALAVAQFFANGGGAAVVVRVGGDVPAAADLIGEEGEGTGLYALAGVDHFNLLCLPDAADLPDPGDAAVVAGAALACCARRRALLLLDPPAALATPAALGEWLALHPELRQPNGALYFPRLLLPDPGVPGGLLPAAASGSLAGVYAASDARRGVWRAPAGLEAQLAGVADLALHLADADQRALNRQGVNCLRAFPGTGVVVWGARTLAGTDGLASDWKYVPVRRLALFIEESVARGLRWAVFEPSDERLWTEIRLRVGEFLHGLWRQGAFAGARPEESYFVLCDATTMSQEDIDGGVLRVVVGVAPAQPAEFVVLHIQAALSARGYP